MIHIVFFLLEMYARLFGAQQVNVESDKINLTGGEVQIYVPSLNDITANNYRILTTQDISPSISLAPIGNSPNSAGATLTAGTLSLQPASSAFGGVMTTSSQSFDGEKNFLKTVTTPTLALPTTASPSTGMILQNGQRFAHSSGLNSTSFGYQAGGINPSPQGSTAFGHQALTNNVGANNTGVGYRALFNIASGHSNTVIGGEAGRNITEGINNTLIGRNAGAGITTGSNNIAIGVGTGVFEPGASSCLQIGPYQWEDEAPSNSIRIGGFGSTSCFITGILDGSISNPTGPITVDSNSQQLAVMPWANEIENHTMTLNVGTISSMTVRGVSTTTLPIQLSLFNKNVSVQIPAFTVLSQSGTANSFLLTGASPIPAKYRPNFDLGFNFCINDNSSLSSLCVVGVSTTGDIIMQLSSTGAFTLPSGPTTDLCLNWTVI